MKRRQFLRGLTLSLLIGLCRLSYADELASTVDGGENAFNMQMFAWLGSVTTNPAWEADTTAMVDEIYASRALSSAIPFDAGLTATMVSQQKPALNRKTLWFGTRITGKGGRRLSLSMLRFAANANDVSEGHPRGSLADDYNPPAGAHYSPTSIGVRWNSAGEFGDRSAHTKLVAGNADELVDEIITGGMQSTYYQYETDAEYSNIQNYMDLVALSLTAWVDVVQSGVLVSRGMRTLPRFGRLAHPVLHIETQPGGKVKIYVTAADNSTVAIQQTPEIGTSASWSTTATVNGSNPIIRSADNNMFYRAILQ